MLSLHSSLPQRSPGSSSQFGQSGFLSHTLLRGMHIPPPHSNCVFGSHFGTGAAGSVGHSFVKLPTWEKNPQHHISVEQLLTAVVLITLVSTLRLARAVQVPWDADHVLALKLVWSACYIMASCYTLVTSTRTVPVTITNPGLVDTGNAVFTLKFTRQAVRWMHWTVRTTLENNNSPSSHLVHCTPLISFNQRHAASQHTSSSEPSGQSRSPSQRHLDVMQKFSEQLNSESGAHGVFGQSFSSELSPQSSSRSHTQRFCMHFPLAQVNSSERQVSSGHAQGNTYKSCYVYCTLLPNHTQWCGLYQTVIMLLVINSTEPTRVSGMQRSFYLWNRHKHFIQTPCLN